MPEQQSVKEQDFVQKRNKRKSTLLKVFNWLFLDRQKKKSDDEEKSLESELQSHLSKLESKPKASEPGKESKSPKELLEAKDINKRHGFRDRLQLAAADLRGKISRASGTAEITEKGALELKEDIVNEYELKTRAKFSESISKYIASGETVVVVEPEVVQKEVKRAEMQTMYEKIIKGEVRFGISEEVELGGTEGKSRKKITINLDAKTPEGEMAPLEKIREARLKEIELSSLTITQKEELKKRLDEEFNILSELRDLRDSRTSDKTDSEIKTKAKELTEKTLDVVEAKSQNIPEEFDYTNIESVADTETLNPKERREVNLETIKVLQTEGSEATKAKLAGDEKEVYRKAESKKKPVRTQFLEANIDGFIAKHNAARKFFEGKDGKHLSEKLLEEMGKDPENEESIKPIEEELTQKENELKEIVSGALAKSGVSSSEGSETAVLTSDDGIIHVPGGVAIVVSDAGRFADLTGLGKDGSTRADIIESIKRRKVAGAFLKGETADLIHKGDGEKSYAGDVIIVYSEDLSTEEGKKKILNGWDRLLEEDNAKSLLLHEIDHLLQKRQLEELASGTGKILDSIDGKDKTPEEIYEDLYKNGRNSVYFNTAPNDPIILALAYRTITKEEALSAYYDSAGIDPTQSGTELLLSRRFLREKLFEFSSILSETNGNKLFDTLDADGALSRIYIKPNEDGEIPQEHRDLYQFILTTHKALIKSELSSADKMNLRREVIGLIQTSYHKGIDYLNEKLVTMLQGTSLNKDELKEIDTIVSSADRTRIYGTDEQISLVPEENSNVDFSVFPVGRAMAEYTGTSPANPNDAIDMVDAMGTSIFGIGYAKERSKELEAQAKEYDETSPEMARYIRLRKPENRGGEEVSPDSTIWMSFVEHLPVVGGFFMPGKIEWAKASLDTKAGHPLYGRTAGRIPVVGQFLAKHYPGLLEKGPLKSEEGYSFDSNKLVSADKNIESILQGLQVGFGAIGLDRQEMNAVIAALPLFKLYQPTPAMEPQVEYSQSELGKADKQIWADRDHWATNFKNEVIYGDVVKDVNGNMVAEVDGEIAGLQTALDAAKKKNVWGKEAVSLEKKLKAQIAIKNELTNSSGGDKNVSQMKKIYDLLEAQKSVAEENRFTMQHLVEFARKAHEGNLWGLDQSPDDKSKSLYFKVRIPNATGGEPVDVALSDVNMFIKKYTRAYVKEMFKTSGDPSTIGENGQGHAPIEILSYEARLAREKLSAAEQDIDTLNQLIANTPTGEKQDSYKIDLLKTEGQKTILKKQIDEGTQKYKFISPEKFKYGDDRFFNIAWGEAESMLDNHKSGMKFYADYRFRVTQAGMIERRTFNTATFYTRLDRVLDNLGHTAVIAGVALAFATGAPAAVTLALVGAGLLLVDAAFVTKNQQIWMARRLKALEAQEKLDNMIGLYEKAASGKMLMPDELDMLTRQKERITFIVESTMKVDAKEVVKFPTNKALFSIIGTGLAIFDEYGSNILAGKI